MANDLQKLADKLLNPKIDLNTNIISHLTLNKTIKKQLRPILANYSKKTEPILQTAAIGGIAKLLFERFPANKDFCETIGAIIESHFSLLRSNNQLFYKLNTLIISIDILNKMNLFDQLNDVVSEYFDRTAEPLFTDGFVATVDMRRLIERVQLGPLELFDKIIKKSNIAVDVWKTGNPLIVCLENIEVLQKSDDEQYNLVVDSLCRSLNTVMNGIVLPFQEHNLNSIGESQVLVSSHNILFFASADFKNLPKVLEEKIGETATCIITANDIIESGFSIQLISSFPNIVPLPHLTSEEYKIMLYSEKFPIFTALKNYIKFSNDGKEYELKFTDSAYEFLYEYTWDGNPNLLKLEGILAYLFVELAIFDLSSDLIIEINDEDFRNILIRKQIIPGEIR